ncbi:MAG: protein-tyrosine kinase [Clostridiales bacterium]|nr:protein-tyrosine kinase [Clostridiales bacterium]
MDNQNYYEEIEIDIKELIGVVLKRFWIIFIVTLVTAIIAFTYSKFRITPQYESTTQIYILSKSEDAERVTYSDLQVGSQLTNDYMALVKSRPVLETVISDLNLDVTNKEFANKIEVSNPSNTRIISITARYSDPEVAKEIVDKIRDVSSEHIKKIMDIEEVNIVEEGNVPQNKVSPNILQNTIIGGILGGIITTLAILIIYFLDDSIKTADDVERYLGLSVLGTIPLQEGETLSKGRKKKKSTMYRNKPMNQPARSRRS